MIGKMSSQLNIFILLGILSLNTPSNANNSSPKYSRPTTEELKKKLSPLQFKVTQKNGTEPPFKNEFYNNKKAGIYVDLISGEPLFSSHDKFDSGTGWPSFTRPLESEHIVTKEDRSLFSVRTEVRSKYGDSHLGHVFKDGPAPTFLRYCINSAALKFIPFDQLKEAGYEKYAPLFKQEANKNSLQTATFAGGCFWCMEPPFEKIKGVVSVVSGYIGGHKTNPNYNEVSSGSTGHAEAVQIVFDPSLISYQQLLKIFWKNIDPTVKNAQFCDVGSQYRSAIFYHDSTQEKLATQSKLNIQSLGFSKIETEITKATQFYVAEDYHQDYSKKNPIRYKYYRSRCGRDDRLESLWKSKHEGLENLWKSF